MSIFSALKGGKLRSPQSIRHNGKKLSEILETHALFTRGAENGVRADLSGADLSGADLGKARLAYVDFRGANLGGAKFYARRAKLASADLEQLAEDLQKKLTCERRILPRRIWRARILRKRRPGELNCSAPTWATQF